jgi:hypothetical protein
VVFPGEKIVIGEYYGNMYILDSGDLIFLWIVHPIIYVL